MRPSRGGLVAVFLEVLWQITEAAGSGYIRLNYRFSAPELRQSFESYQDDLPFFGARLAGYWVAPSGIRYARDSI
jgi:hypothetical protein